ncbi:MAG: hypothetical protein Pg6B_01470 [Candidatus Azobacteroides pseudotrichonymphae]|jgi:hypothetical protein|nr:MAG: hypothetical protein Pg6B_01470 [Candidatus Azobacteroides pseudotrichonymphae]
MERVHFLNTPSIYVEPEIIFYFSKSHVAKFNHKSTVNQIFFPEENLRTFSYTNQQYGVT